MAGTIVVDRLESDASYASRINVASEIQFSNAITGNVNIDSGLLFVDAVNNRVGVNTQNPGSALDISGGVFVRGSTNPGGITNRVVIDYNGFSGIGTISANSTGGDTSLVFGTSKSGSNATRMTINQDGHITSPFQPALLAQPDSAGNFNGSVSPSTGSIFGWNASGGIRYNRGFTIGASSGTASNTVANGSNTGRITVPSAGIYLIMFDHRNEAQQNSGTATYGNDSNGGQMVMWINGVNRIRRHVNQWANFPYNHMILHATVSLNANDYLEFGAWWNTGSALSWQGTGDTVNWLHIVKIA